MFKPTLRVKYENCLEGGVEKSMFFDLEEKQKTKTHYRRIQSIECRMIIEFKKSPKGGGDKR